jgi:hypothetical protein
VFLHYFITFNFFIAFVLFIYFSLNVTSLLLNLFCMLFLVIVTLIKGLYDMMQILTGFVFLKMWIFLRNIYFSFVLLFCLLLFHFLILMMCLVLLVLSQVLCKRRRTLPLLSFKPLLDLVLHTPRRSTKVF